MTRILIIEDNELNQKLMNDILEFQDYETDTASNGQIGLEKVAQNNYDLILLDLQMPVVSGYDFLKVYDKETPVIVVSACAMETEINKAFDLGCTAFIPKPINIKDFLKTIDEVLSNSSNQ